MSVKVTTVRGSSRDALPAIKPGSPMEKVTISAASLPSAAIAASMVRLPSACVVAMLVGVANNFGYSPFTVWPLSHHSEPFMPGDRTCNGGAYTFQIPGALAVADNVVIPMRVHDSASIRCIYAYVPLRGPPGRRCRCKNVKIRLRP